MKCPLIIGGTPILRAPFQGISAFYPEYTYAVGDAGLLDLAAAIGRARQAARPDFATRAAWLREAARRFTYSTADLEHAVRLTGMPIRVIDALFREVPAWLQAIPDLLSQRFTGESELYGGALVEPLQDGLARLLLPPDGFCYAVTPGNDPRAVALAAGNLAALGVPFILRASPKDALAPLIFRALLEGGLDPNFGSLVYLDSHAPDVAQKHFKLVQASTLVWIFGPGKNIEEALRYETQGQRAAIDLSGVPVDELDLARLAALLAERGFQVESDRRDHFEGKRVIRHNTGNCAAIARWPTPAAFDPSAQAGLLAALQFPLGCTSTRSLMLVEGGEAVIHAIASFLAALKTGDPLDPETQVGFLAPQTLDHLQSLLRQNRLHVNYYGGERISAIQAHPLLVTGQTGLSDFFGQEIPAYILAVRACPDLPAAVSQVNHFTGSLPRLAVSLHGFSPQECLPYVSILSAHTLLLDMPTTTVIPVFHEGNDYAQTLSLGKVVVRRV